MRNSGHNKPGVGYSVQYSISGEGHNKEEVTGDLRLDRKSVV